MITKRQKELIDFIKEFYLENGYGPSYDEMKDALGLAAKSNIHTMIKSLEVRGFVRRLPHMARSIEVIDK